jgi:putative zinc finger/helix-turn-helix YgiT family protein
MTEFKFCPLCGANEIENIISGDDVQKIKNESFTVKANYLKCNSCGEKFYLPKEKQLAIERARNEYRNKYSIPSPIEIREFMDKYNLSIRDMGKITGIAFKTIDRYLNGVIPTLSNANLLRSLLYYPQIFLDLMLNTHDFSKRKASKLFDVLSNEVDFSSIKICKSDFKQSIIYVDEETEILQVESNDSSWSSAESDIPEVTGYRYAV